MESTVSMDGFGSTQSNKIKSCKNDIKTCKLSRLCQRTRVTIE